MKIFLSETALFKQDIKLPKRHWEISDILEKFVLWNRSTINQDVKEKKEVSLFSGKYSRRVLNIWRKKSILGSPVTESVLKRKASQRETQWSNILLTQKGKWTNFIYFRISWVFCLLLLLLIALLQLHPSLILFTKGKLKSEWLMSWGCEFLSFSMHKSLLLILNNCLLLFKNPQKNPKRNNYDRKLNVYFHFW